jgi:hypothetical protein
VIQKQYLAEKLEEQADESVISWQNQKVQKRMEKIIVG